MALPVFRLFDAVVGAAHHAIEVLAALLTPAVGSVAAALAIVVFTLLVRLAISPLTYLQARGERRRRALAPQLARLLTSSAWTALEHARWRRPAPEK